MKVITDECFGQIGGLKHGFFTREGGVSVGLYESLNLGLGSDDNRDCVMENRRRVAKYVGCDKVVTLSQVHSSKVVRVVGDSDYGSCEADAMVTDVPGVALGVLTADCAPVLFADVSKGIVGAAHAGWRGSVDGVLENTVDAMREMGAESIEAVIGPTIGRNSYEVGQEFYDQFIKLDDDNNEFFECSIRDKYFMFDLPAYVKSRLGSKMLCAVNDVACDTYIEENNLYSYRRSCHLGHRDFGRNISVVMLTT